MYNNKIYISGTSVHSNRNTIQRRKWRDPIIKTQNKLQTPKNIIPIIVRTNLIPILLPSLTK